MQQDEWAIPPIKIRGGLNLWVLMVAVVIVALGCFTVARPKHAGGVGLAIVGTSIVCLAYKRYSNIVALRQAKGLTTGWLRKFGLCLGSAIVATLVIGLSDIAFVIGWRSYMDIAASTTVASHWSPDDDSGHQLMSMGIAVIMALGVA